MLRLQVSTRRRSSAYPEVADEGHLPLRVLPALHSLRALQVQAGEVPVCQRLAQHLRTQAPHLCPLIFVLTFRGHMHDWIERSWPTAVHSQKRISCAWLQGRPRVCWACLDGEHSVVGDVAALLLLPVRVGLAVHAGFRHEAVAKHVTLIPG